MSARTDPLLHVAPEPVTFTGVVHPYAERWPMRSPDEIAEMADSIRSRRQRLPIVLTPEGVLVDGRNRLLACDRAGIEPWFEVDHTLTDEDEITAYIWDANGDRRNLTQGQRAMLAALIPGSVRSKSEHSGLPVGRLGEAQTIHKWCPDDVIESVIAGTTPFDAAYTQAQQIKATEQADDIARKRAAKEAQEQAAKEANLLADLRANRPDLADLVDEGRLGVNDALRLRAEEAAKERRRAESKAAADKQRVQYFREAMATLSDLKHDQHRETILDCWEPGAVAWTADDLRANAAHLLAFADEWTHE